jgi:hypothetical protein
LANNYKPRHSLRTAVPETCRIEWASKEQLQGFQYGPYPLLLSGGYGAAKTFTACFKALFLSDTFPNNRGLIARRVWDDLRKTTMATFFKLCPDSAWSQGRRSDTEKVLRLNNGSEIIWAHLDDPETENLIQGIEINWFLLDQCEEIEEEIFEKLLTRLGRWDKVEVPEAVIDRFMAKYDAPWPWTARTGQPIPPNYAMATCNPDTKLHWLYRRFHEDSPEHWDRIFVDPKSKRRRVSYHDLGYRMINMRSVDNKHLPEQNLEQLLARDKSFVDRYVMGKWGLPEGIIHTVDDKSILDPTPQTLSYIFTRCQYFSLSYDHGESAPSCMGWWADDVHGNVFMYREYYQGDTLILQHRRNIHDLCKTDLLGANPVSYSMRLADPAIFNKTMQSKGGRYSVSDEYEDRKIDPETAIFFQPGDNDELGTRNRINELLRVDSRHENPITGELGAPRLYFVRKTDNYPNGVRFTLQQLQAQRRTKVGMYLGKPLFSDERDTNIEDHGYDQLRYKIASRITPASKVEARRLQGTFKGACLLLDRMKHDTRNRTSARTRREARRYGRDL